jgi:hypothetical protein
MNPSQVAEIVSQFKMKNANLINIIQEKDNLIVALNKKITEKDNDKEIKEILNKLDSQNTKYTYTGNFIIYE